MKHKPGLRFRSACLVNDLAAYAPGSTAALTAAMNFCLILFAVQLAVTLFAVTRERKTNTAFEADKLPYRS